MHRLIAFGCSCTYGVGLLDCFVPPTSAGPKPSKTAWPETLGKLFNVDEVINKSRPGASNKYIWKCITDFNFKDTDIVFINWAQLDRYAIFNSDNNCHQIGNWQISWDKRSKVYYKQMHTDYDSKYDFYIRADHASRYLKSINVRHYHTAMGVDTNDAILKSPQWFSVDFMNTSLYNIRDLHPTALDNIHPGQEAHDHFANDLHLEIKEQFND